MWKDRARPLAAIVAILFMGFFPFVRHTRVPLLGWADLGFHELGHLVGYLVPISERLTAALGSITQVAVPAGLAVYFLWIRSDRVAGALMLAWAGTSAWDASVYIADAPYEQLPLIGGDHDWAFLLGPNEFNALDRADEIAGLVSFLGASTLIFGLILCGNVLWPSVGNLLARRKPARHLKGLPVREARWGDEQPDSGNTIPG